MKILFYPNKVIKVSIWRYLCQELGLKPTNNINRSFDLAVYYNIAGGRPTFPDERIMALSKEMRVINIGCTNVLKGLVDKTWGDVSGDSITIDPETYSGSYVRKSQLNWRSHTGEVHDGRVFSQPMEYDREYVYQRLILNNSDLGYLTYRMTMVNKKPAVLWLKHCRFPFKQRGGLVKAESFQGDSLRNLFTQAELININIFNRRMGVDFASVDFLRDKYTGILYGIDVNEKAGMDASASFPDKGKGFIKDLAQYFEKEFLI